MRNPKCGACVLAVLNDSRLLENGDWRVGSDGRYHWKRAANPRMDGILIEPRGVCGVRVVKG